MNPSLAVLKPPKIIRNETEYKTPRSPFVAKPLLCFFFCFFGALCFFLCFRNLKKKDNLRLSASREHFFTMCNKKNYLSVKVKVSFTFLFTAHYFPFSHIVTFFLLLKFLNFYITHEAPKLAFR